MYAFEINITNNNFKEKYDQQYEDWIHFTYDYIYHLERTGQVLKTNGYVIINTNTIKVSVICPEKTSLNIENHSTYNIKTINRIEKNAKTKIKHHLTGVYADYQNYKVPKNSSYYILRTGWASPLLCGDTHQPIPLYKIPKTDHNETDYDNIYFWNQDYERLYGLWLSSGAYEQFAQEQLQNPYSAINKRGREICSIIEELTNIPTYYFLFNYRNLTEDEDKQRKCPITKKEWLIKGKTSSDFIAFKCDESKLVSALSTNSK